MMNDDEGDDDNGADDADNLTTNTRSGEDITELQCKVLVEPEWWLTCINYTSAPLNAQDYFPFNRQASYR